jgi:hypothetical protein
MEKVPIKTLKKVEEDIKNNDLGKARDRLHGLIATYPNEIKLRKKLGDIYWELKYPSMAGRYWYLAESKTQEMIQACQKFEGSLGNDPIKILRSLKFKGDSEFINNLQSRLIFSSLEKQDRKRRDEEIEETWDDKLIPIIFISFLIFSFLFFLLGIYTALTWIF